MCAAEQHMDGKFKGQPLVRLTAATPSVCCEACATFYAAQVGGHTISAMLLRACSML